MIVSSRSNSQSGFSIAELLIVMCIVSTLVAMQVPQALQMMHVFRLNNATSQFSGLIQSARSFSTRDARNYSVYFIPSQPITEAYVDIKGSVFDSTSDPLTSWNSEVTPLPATSAPGSAALKTAAFSGATFSSAVTVIDGNANSGNGVTFSAMGMPCVPVSHAAGRACNSATSSTPIAYWVFFQNTASQSWEAVTISPAGRIQRWTYSDSTWHSL